MILETKIQIEKHKFSTLQEEEQSRKLSLIQKQHLENLLRDCITEKLSLPPGNDFSHEYLRGQISILQYILALSI